MINKINKKNTDKDIMRKSPLFFGVGLCVSLMVVITAFEWKFYNEGELVDLGMTDQAFEEILDIPLTQQPPPPPPQRVAPPVIVEAPEEEILEEVELALDIEITEEESPEVFIPSVPMEEEEVEEVLTIVEEMPSPKGGYEEFYKFIGENMVYPAVARKAGIEGKVVLEITINKKGKLDDARVVKGIGYGCDDEALRVMKLWEEWNPGKQRGVPRTIRMYMPITFKFS